MSWLDPTVPPSPHSQPKHHFSLLCGDVFLQIAMQEKLKTRNQKRAAQRQPFVWPKAMDEDGERIGWPGIYHSLEKRMARKELDEPRDEEPYAERWDQVFGFLEGSGLRPDVRLRNR